MAFVVQAVSQAFSSATSLAALEILISTRAVRGSAVNTHLAELMAKLTDLGRQLGIVVAQMTWPEPVDQSRDLQTRVDVVSTYIELRT